MQPEQQNPYDFMLAEPPAKQGFTFDASGKKQRLIIVGAGALILIIIAWILISIIGNAGKKDQVLAFKVAAAQQDMIGLTSLGVNNVRDRYVISQSTTASIIITGQNKDTNAYIASLKIKGYGKQIAAYVNSSYKAKLETARSNGNYNEVYKALYTDRFNSYSSLLNQTYASTSIQKLKDMMRKYSSQLNSIDPNSTTDN
ncbi:MAG: hypothetical protein WCP03_00075 [Candidatus Saccharibacteria bacterium]